MEKQGPENCLCSSCGSRENRPCGCRCEEGPENCPCGPRDQEVNDYESEKCTKFYGLTTEWLDDPNRVIPESEAILSKALRYRTDWAPVRYFSSKFAYDISTQPLGCFGSVVFPALQFALWTNPRRLYLVGCDCSLSGYSYDKEYKNFLLPNKIIEAYREFKIFASKYYPETEIISVNPVGLKGIFTDEYQNK